jgi:hypothetical protein
MMEISLAFVISNVYNLDDNTIYVLVVGTLVTRCLMV